MLLAVKSGAGLTPLPVAVGDHDGELVRVIDDIPQLVMAHFLLTHRDLQHSPRVRAFFDFVAAEIKAFRACDLNKGNRNSVAALASEGLKVKVQPIRMFIR